MKMLTILTVSYGHRALLLENLRLAKSLHANFQDAVDWYVAENGPKDHPDRCTGDETGLIVRPGAGETGLGISHHHATALNELLRTTPLNRHVLILDPDFFLLFPDWAHTVPKYMLSRNLGFFGVPWHPRHNENYRYFPAVHCFAFDSKAIDPASLDFTPDTEILTWKDGRTVRFLHLIPIIGYRLTKRPWDTGTRVWKHYRRHAVKQEIVTPIHQPESASRKIKNRLIESLLPDWMCSEPKQSDYFSIETFQDRGWLHNELPCQWESFVWRNLPFGLHVRRSYANHLRNEVDELSALPDILGQILASLGSEADQHPISFQRMDRVA